MQPPTRQSEATTDMLEIPRRGRQVTSPIVSDQMVFRPLGEAASQASSSMIGRQGRGVSPGRATMAMVSVVNLSGSGPQEGRAVSVALRQDTSPEAPGSIVQVVVAAPITEGPEVHPHDHHRDR